MNIYIFLLLLLLLFIGQVDLRRRNDSDHRHERTQLNKEFLHDLFHDQEDSPSTFQREKKYSSRKKVLEDVDEPEKPSRHSHSSRTNNRSRSSDTRNHPASSTTTTQQSYLDEASLCINEFDIKTEQLVKVKELKNGAHMIRFVRIEEPSTSHGLDIRDICMLNCCVEKYCDLAMLSEQRTNDGYKCYLFACNGSCTYAPHQDYTSMILKKEAIVDDDSSSISNKPSSDASSSTLTTTCRSSEFSCRDGSCIPYYDVCNSYEDCPSGIDEAMCSPEFILHQRTQKENRLKPSVDVDTDPNTDPEEVVEESGDEDPTTTVKSIIKSSSTKPSASKSKSLNREGSKQTKNITSSYLYNTDLDTQQQLSKLQKLKEHLEDTKGPEAWYHLFQTLVQHQQQDQSNIEPEQPGSSSTDDDDENFKDHLLALEQQWIADRQKTSPTSTTTTTTIKPRVNNRKTTTTTTTTTTTKRMKVINDDDLRERRPPTVTEDELPDEEEEEGSEDDNSRYYWQPTYDDRRGDRYKNPQKSKTTSTTTTRKSKMRYSLKESSMTTLLRANGVESETYSHGRSFLRESSVILLLMLGLIFTIILLVLVGFYCRDSWKHGRILKNRSTDADYLVNGLYL